jgi:hypothetical protein
MQETVQDIQTKASIQVQGIAGSVRVTECAMSAIAVTPSNATTLPVGCQGLWVGGAGAVAVTFYAGSSVVFSAVPAGTLLKISPSQVLSTGTTATLILALY